MKIKVNKILVQKLKKNGKNIFIIKYYAYYKNRYYKN